MSRKSVKPVLTERQVGILVALIKRRGSAQQLVGRARIVLLAAEQKSDVQIASEVGVCVDTVGSWRKRWLEQVEKLAAIEAEGDKKVLRDLLGISIYCHLDT